MSNFDFQVLATREMSSLAQAMEAAKDMRFLCDRQQEDITYFFVEGCINQNHYCYAEQQGWFLGGLLDGRELQAKRSEC